MLALVAGLPLALAVALAASTWPLWLTYLGVVLVAAGADAVIGLPGSRLRVHAQMPDTLYVGDRDELRLDIRAPGWRRATPIEVIVDLDDELAQQPMQRALLSASEAGEGGAARAQLRVPLVPARRGTMEVARVWLQWRGPLGLMRRQRVVPLARELRVVPNVRAVRTAALRFFSSRAFLSGLKVERYLGDGSEFDALREYAPGLDHRSIDWKASARHLKLLSREFRAERNHQVVVAVDTGQLMREPLAGIPKLDHAINAALMLGYFCLRTGDRVGLFGFDARVRCFIEPSGGVHSFARLERQSAALDYQHEETNFTLGLTELSRRLRRRSLVVLLTDVVDTVTTELMLENLQRLARRHLVVFVTLRDTEVGALAEAPPRTLAALHRAVVADDLLREREVVLQRLRRLGVYCIDAPPQDVSMSLLNRYLDIKRRELLS
ncbi:DUF58 domain-containing protein [Haliangium ochraceum]|uniref:DUF58 domain-containing protein n=1 Tax=Haliangium ochraceum TaxID=80816 RepID=UPI0002DA4E7F|nr:DUF58 domain-containing protein [Haliangium ochraceum]